LLYSATSPQWIMLELLGMIPKDFRAAPFFRNCIMLNRPGERSWLRRLWRFCCGWQSELSHWGPKDFLTDQSLTFLLFCFLLVLLHALLPDGLAMHCTGIVSRCVPQNTRHQPPGAANPGTSPKQLPGARPATKAAGNEPTKVRSRPAIKAPISLTSLST
jgi:hypothetical protein